jgi:hypothetical protein
VVALHLRLTPEHDKTPSQQLHHNVLHLVKKQAVEQGERVHKNRWYVIQTLFDASAKHSDKTEDSSQPFQRRNLVSAPLSALPNLKLPAAVRA